jgi:DNA-binding transcriptional ArsR family regulator
MISADPAQPVFRALADPTRRAIVSMLAGGARPIAEIASEFEMTRPAVAKHLAILREGGLITVEAHGRQRINKLNPGGLKDAADWINHFDRFWDERLAELKQVVEEK